MATHIQVAHGAGAWTAEVEGEQVRLVDGDKTFVVRDAGSGRMAVERDGVAREAVAAIAGDTVWIGVDGEAIAFTIVRGGARAATAMRDQDALTPPMSATVVRIQAAPGQRVHAGDTLVVLEAMKMELPIRAPRDGTVRAVRCAEGQLVDPGTVLVDLDA